MEGGRVIDLTTHDKAEVLAVLYNYNRPQGLGIFHFEPNPMTKEEAQTLLDENEYQYFDYLKGRVMKIDLSGDKLDPALYDRDNGKGAAERAISTLSET